MALTGHASPILTIGHGNRSEEEFISLLQHCAVGRLVDVRAHPGSRRHPQFGRAALERSLISAGISYAWEGEALGGRRRPRTDSLHHALRNESFRAYHADHMQSDEFAAGIARLLDSASETRVVIMCAERLPWQCHRFMISDYLVAHDVEVAHVINESTPRLHRLRQEARLVEGLLRYDRDTQTALGIDDNPAG